MPREWTGLTTVPPLRRPGFNARNLCTEACPALSCCTASSQQQILHKRVPWTGGPVLLTADTRQTGLSMVLFHAQSPIQ